MRLFIHDFGGYPFTVQLAGALAARGHQVFYAYSVTTQMMQRFLHPPDTTGLTITPVKLARPYARYRYLRRRVAEIDHGRQVARMVMHERPAVLISANAPLDSQRVIQDICHEVGTKFIFWMQDAIGLAVKQALSGRFLGVGQLIGDYYAGMERDLARRSDHLVLISEDFLEYIEGWGIDRSRVSIQPNWAPLALTAPLPRHNAWAAAHSLEDKFVFLFSGVLGLKHEIQPFLALARAFIDTPDVRIVVIAEGPYADELRDHVKREGLGNLILLAYQQADEYPFVLASADVLLTVLNQEAGRYSVPSKVYSHMCAGIPQLLSIPPENAAARIIEENRIGLVSAPGDLEGWVRNAARLYRERAVDEMGLNGLQYAHEHFAIDPIAANFESWFALCMKEP